MELIFTLENLPAAAKTFGEKTAGKKVFAFHGAMGAGKTTFITALCSLMGVSGNISSPTFSIINEYHTTTGKIYHLDLYRLKGTDEAIQAGVEDVLYSNEICFVEWPEQAPEIFPDDTVHVLLELIDEHTRKLSITS